MNLRSLFLVLSLIFISCTQDPIIRVEPLEPAKVDTTEVIMNQFIDLTKNDVASSQTVRTDNNYSHVIEGLDENLTKKYITSTNASKYNIYNSKHSKVCKKNIIEYSFEFGRSGYCLINSSP